MDDDELDTIVADYFSILSAELSPQPYIKSHHSAVLMQQIGRTHRFVECKHQNISDVLEEMGLPWIVVTSQKEITSHLFSERLTATSRRTKTSFIISCHQRYFQ